MPITVVVWDHIGNVMWGVRPWDEWTPHIQERLPAEDPDAVAHSPAGRRSSRATSSTYAR